MHFSCRQNGVNGDDSENHNDHVGDINYNIDRMVLVIVIMAMILAQ